MTLRAPLSNKNSQQYKKAHYLFVYLFFNLKLGSLQTWYTLPNPENSWSRRLSSNHVLCQRPCPSIEVCGIDPKSFGQVIHPKHVLVLLKRFENPNLHLTPLQPVYSPFPLLTGVVSISQRRKRNWECGATHPTMIPGHSRRQAALRPWPGLAAPALGTHPAWPHRQHLCLGYGTGSGGHSRPDPRHGKSQERVGLQLQNGNCKIWELKRQEILADVDGRVLLIFRWLRTPWSNERESSATLWIWPLFLTLPSQQAVTFIKQD